MCVLLVGQARNAQDKPPISTGVAEDEKRPDGDLQGGDGGEDETGRGETSGGVIYK